MSREFSEETHKPLRRYCAFYRGKPGSKTRFAAIILHKSSILVRIRANTSKLSDPEKWLGTKVYKGTFLRFASLRRKSAKPWEMQSTKSMQPYVES
jgi:hypothetical protein